MESSEYYYNAVKKLILKNHAVFRTTKEYEDFINDLANLFEI
jgi:hypothetical protein